MTGKCEIETSTAGRSSSDASATGKPVRGFTKIAGSGVWVAVGGMVVGWDVWDVSVAIVGVQLLSRKSRMIEIVENFMDIYSNKNIVSLRATEWRGNLVLVD